MFGFCPEAMRDPMAMERANLLNMAKLSIKGLIESALSFGRTLDSDYPPLQQFFVVMEHCLKHGLRGKKEQACKMVSGVDVAKSATPLLLNFHVQAAEVCLCLPS